MRRRKEDEQSRQENKEKEEEEQEEEDDDDEHDEDGDKGQQREGQRRGEDKRRAKERGEQPEAKKTRDHGKIKKESITEKKLRIVTQIITNMAGATRIEINFNRLLGQCQVMAEDKENRDWRFDKYIGSLQNFLTELKKSQSKPSKEVLLDYQRKVDLLKGLSEAEKKPSAADRALITERLCPVSTNIASNKARELQTKAKVRCEEDLRAELFSSSSKSSLSKDADSTDLRHRKKPPEDEEDIDTILQHHHKMQEKLAEEMLFHTRALKLNITEAGKIVKDDSKTILDSQTLADTNMSRLKVESERLEAHTKTCSWWIWVMLLIVVITFVAMIPFMRLFSK
ncbi:unconventional snare in the er 1 homolog [Plakobranchus ocellatus]|uniref:Vesicle transport protein USE1 n=1 Tax=Plakobranchus ocellatus TaxID=259542 RepID=A0AAV4B221_9GAST|nr:unconventional snare in the er 1 homolog [Plakobranchus ocellatus]